MNEFLKYLKKCMYQIEVIITIKVNVIDSGSKNIFSGASMVAQC